ncbi:MAG: radical SAM protein [Oscillospiraceae bacterium]|nr:radical SAM protein [Oscillospiraceae bacterium]
MRYEGGVYRPPGEWQSYILQATVGCSYNKCTFCEAYKKKLYHVKPLSYVLDDIAMASVRYPNTETVFIADGDAIALPMDYLLTVLAALKDAFPHLRRITCYAGPISTMEKTAEQLKQLKENGLGRVYLGVESGDSELLKKVKKGVDAQGMLKAGLALKNAGFDLWVTVIAGLEGSGEGYKKNALLTAELLNAMAPQHISVMTYMATMGTEMYEDVMAGRFKMQTPREALLETRLLVEKLNLPGAHFTANHMSNYRPLKGTLGRDTDLFLCQIDEMLAQADRVKQRTIYRHG